MAINIISQINDNHVYLTDIHFTNFTMIGFQISKQSDTVDFYFVFITNQNKTYLIKKSFKLGKDKELDLEYFNHPYHQSMFINKYGDEKRDKIKRFICEFDHSRSYYSDFHPIDMTNDLVTCQMIHTVYTNHNFDNIQEIIKFVIPINIYLQIISIQNDVLFRHPINLYRKYDDCKIINDVNISYLGGEIIKDNKLMLYYSLQVDNNKIGLFIPTIGSTNKPIAKYFSSIKFQSFYKNNFMIDTTKYMVIDQKIDNMIIPRLALIRNYKSNQMDLYVINENITSSIILNPFSYIYA